jgi:iron complex transport system ATP-binding protein
MRYGGETLTILDVKGLGFYYDQGHKIIDGIDIHIDRPGLYCIIGPNGVGKSTLVKCINRVLRPTEGSVTVDGTDLSTLRQKEISRLIGYVPTSTEDVFSMPVIDTIRMGMYNIEGSTSKDELEEVYRVMKLMHIRNLANRGFKELSAGQRQKVSIARGLVQNTPILILDEPTANLDIKYQIYVTELLRGVAISKGMIILMISHDLNITARFAHEVIMMSSPGVIFCRGTASETITEENLKEVYDIQCSIIDVEGTPHVISGTSVMEEDDLS